jgi:hypothetical protein
MRSVQPVACLLVGFGAGWMLRGILAWSRFLSFRP